MSPTLDTKRTRWVSPLSLELARRSSPADFLRGHFGSVDVTRGGASLEVHGVLRGDLRGDRWISCDWAGQGIGDNVALVQHLLGCSFQDAVLALVDGPTDPGRVQISPVVPASAQRPRLPASAGPEAGRAYLESRGIPHGVVALAEQGGSLRHLRNGVAFVGRDGERDVRAVTVRYFEPMVLRDGTAVGKRDLVGTDKTFPCILDGDPGRVVIAEGGVTGLAVQALVQATGRPAPTVVVTGGLNVVRWTEADGPAAHVLRHTSRITVAGERETDGRGRPDAAKQARTDDLRDGLVARLRAASAASVRVVLPPEGCKDAVDWLSRRRA